MTTIRHWPAAGAHTFTAAVRRPVRGAVATVAAALLVFAGCASTGPTVRSAADPGIEATQPGTDPLPAEGIMASRGYVWNDLHARSDDRSSSADVYA